MDRDELQDRIRARRASGDPYRRGNVTDESDPEFQRFQPEAEDTQARRARRPDDRRHDVFQERIAPTPPPAPDPAAASLVPPIEPRPDITRDSDDWVDRPAAAGVPPPPPPPAASVPLDQPEHVDNYDDDAHADQAYEPYEYDEWDDGRDRRSSGAGAFAILGFLALGVLALLGGAVLAGVFSGDPNTGGLDPTLTPSPSLSESLAPSSSASTAPSGSGDPSSSPGPSGEPVVFPDGFTAEVQPCIPGSADLDGCDSNGASNSGAVDMWVGFRDGTGEDVVGVTLIGPDGSTISEGSIELADIQCGQTCTGYTRFSFSGLGPGDHEVRVTRNGDLAAITTFVVE